MERYEKASLSIKKVLAISLIFILLSGIGVMATNVELNTVTIILSNGYIMEVVTTKKNVNEILEENNIILTDDEKVYPEDEITERKTITITKASEQEIHIAQISEEGQEITLDKILESYATVTEKIETEEVTIPYETITKDATDGSASSRTTVLVQGKNGLKLVTYKVKYQNEVEIERTVLSEEILEEPVDKVVQVKSVSSRGSSSSRTSIITSANAGTSLGVFKITSYCPCSICCGKYASGYTASGTKATANRTIAAPPNIAFGTKLLINGVVYTVEDRGGAIKGNKIDVYRDTHQSALNWGVKYYEVFVVND